MLHREMDLFCVPCEEGSWCYSQPHLSRVCPIILAHHNDSFQLHTACEPAQTHGAGCSDTWSRVLTPVLSRQPQGRGRSPGSSQDGAKGWNSRDVEEQLLIIIAFHELGTEKSRSGLAWGVQGVVRTAGI